MKDNVNSGLNHFTNLSGDYGAKALAPIKEHFPDLAEFIMGMPTAIFFNATQSKLTGRKSQLSLP